MKNKTLLVLFLSLFALSIFAQAKNYPIEWTPKKIEKTIGLGGIEELTVTFVSSARLEDVDLWIVPELQSFVSLEPNHFEIIEANISYEVEVRFFIPYYTETKLYDGNIHLREDSKTYPQTLKVELNIVDVAETVGPEGGTVITVDGMATVEIPQEALSEDTVITIAKTGEVGTIGDVYEFGPSELNFQTPITISIAYDLQSLPEDVMEDDLFLVTETKDGYLEPLTDNIIDKITYRIAGKTVHFSEVWITHGWLVEDRNNQPVLAEDIPLATSFRMPIGDSRDLNYITIICHDTLSQSPEDLGDNINLLTIGSYGNYPKIEFNAEWASNRWIVAVAFNKDKYLTNYDTGTLANYGVFHPGEDWNNRIGGASDNGMAIHAIADGIVLFSQRQIGNISKREDKTIAFGNIVVIGHKLSNGSIIASSYAHMQQLSPCSVGEYVNKGDIIGLIGDTGLQIEDNHHLHFEIIKTTFVENASSKLGQFHTPIIDNNSKQIYIRYSKKGKNENGWYWPKKEAIIEKNYYEPSQFIKTTPSAKVSPDIGPAGNQFLLEWSGFYFNSTLTSHLKKPDGTEFPPKKFYTDNQGNASHAVDSTGFDEGIYEHWAVDDATGKESNTVTFTITTADNPPDIPTLIAPDHNVWINYDPVFKAQVSDPDGGMVRAYFDIVGYGSGFGTWVESGGISEWGPVNLGTCAQYNWRARAQDSCDLTSDWTAYWRIGVDKNPSISDINYPTGTINYTTFTVNLTELEDCSAIRRGALYYRYGLSPDTLGRWWFYSFDIDDLNFTGQDGYSYQFKYRVQDLAGNWSDFAEGEAVTIRITNSPDIPILQAPS